MRGKLMTGWETSPVQRNIPAYAGKTINGSSVAWLIKEHPRVCGENLVDTIVSNQSEGTSPRMRGKQC